METMNAIAHRTSVRAYRPEQISEQALQAILNAGCAAPVGMAQYDTLRITVLQDQALLGQISNTVRENMQFDTDPLYGAPTLILISSQTPMGPGMDYANAACVMENMLVAAADLDVGSVIVWGSAIAVEASNGLKKALGIPEGFHPVMGAVFGLAQGEVRDKALGQTIHMDRV